jgi:putative transposase
VDTLGLLLAVVVTAANVDDAKAAQRLFAQMPSRVFYRLEQVQADHKYHSPDLDRWLRIQHRGYEVVVVSREPGERRFVPLKSRWVVERTFAWLGRYRRLSKDYEHTPSSSEAVVKIAAIHRRFPQRGKRLTFLLVEAGFPGGLSRLLSVRSLGSSRRRARPR